MSEESEGFEKRINDLNESVRKLRLDFERYALTTEKKIDTLTSIYNELVPHRESQPHQISSISEATPEPRLKNSLSDKGNARCEETNLPERVRDIIPVARTALQNERVSQEVLDLLPNEISGLKYQPLHHRILTEIRKILAKNAEPTKSAISCLTNINRDELGQHLQKMFYNDFVEMKGKGKSTLYFPSKNPFIQNLFEPTLKHRREGGEIAFRLLVSGRGLFSEDWLYIALKQVPNLSMPDVIAIPPLEGKRERWGWSFIGAIPIEIESPDAVRAHPDQVMFNLVKDFAIGFKKLEVYCLRKSYDKILSLIADLPDDIGDRAATGLKALDLNVQQQPCPH